MIDVKYNGEPIRAMDAQEIAAHLFASTRPSREVPGGHVPLLLIPLPNGGWVIAEKSRPGELNDPIGAYSDTEQMMDGLARLVLPPPSEKEADMASDYSFETDVLRGQMARVLSGNEEQFVHVLSDALMDVDVERAIEQGQLGDTAENYPDEVVKRLRKIADAIEDGKIT